MSKDQVNGSIQDAAGGQAKEEVNIINTGSAPLKLHTLWAPPNPASALARKTIRFIPDANLKSNLLPVMEARP